MPVRNEVIEWLSLRYGTGFNSDLVDLSLTVNIVKITLKIPCQFLTKRRRCQIYAQRPPECRLFFCQEVKEKYRIWKDQVIKGIGEKA